MSQFVPMIHLSALFETVQSDSSCFARDLSPKEIDFCRHLSQLWGLGKFVIATLETKILDIGLE